MIALAALALRPVLRQPPAEEEGEAHFDIDDDGYVTSSHWLWPEQAEIIYGGLASLIVIGLLVWKAGPLIKKALADRTARIQAELDASAKDRADAEAEAAHIRQALGDIDAERQRLLAEADAQAEALLTDGHGRLDAELAELEAKAEADIAAAATRSSDELRAEIARPRHGGRRSGRQPLARRRHAAALIEDFIQKVGATA